MFSLLRSQATEISELSKQLAWVRVSNKMVRITEELVRKKSEHNECEIRTLEELSLHQENIEKIEHLQNWCRDLQILLLQSNLISKIENLGKLKKLQYLNLALNNIQRIENLEGLESLEKLDLTLNFIGEVTSVHNLKGNYNMKDLFLTGNPCTDYKGYREYVIIVLPQLKRLDGVEISRSERIIANQNFKDHERSIKREEEKFLTSVATDESWRGGDADSSGESEKDMTEEELQAFWSSPSRNTPKDRIAIAKKSQRISNVDRKREEKKTPKPVKLTTHDGRRLNINQSRIPFTLIDDGETGCKILDVAVYRHLDTSLINVDLHPGHVTVSIKGKILQITFDEDVAVDKSTCQRSQTTGHLVVTMPKAGAELKPKLPKKDKPQIPPPCYVAPSKREYLEIGPADDEMDLSNIIENNKYKSRQTKMSLPTPGPEKKPPLEFIDNSEVPPLV